MPREGTAPASWPSIILRLVLGYCHIHFVLQQLMSACIDNFYAGAQEHFWLLGMAMGLALFQSLLQGKKPMQIDWIGVRTSQHRHWMHQDAYGAHWVVIPTHSRSLLLASYPGAQSLHFWFSHGQWDVVVYHTFAVILHMAEKKPYRQAYMHTFICAHEKA